MLIPMRLSAQMFSSEYSFILSISFFVVADDPNIIVTHF